MGLPADRLYPTVHPDDTDAYAIWRDEIGVPEERIGKLSDNWWGPVGNTGPNGPDSEIYFDLRSRGSAIPATARATAAAISRSGTTSSWSSSRLRMARALRLPSQNVDTGMGLER